MPLATRHITLAAILAFTSLTLPGCYKGEAEAQKTRADDLQKQLDEANGKLSSANKEVAAFRGPASKFEAMSRGGMKLAVIVNGQRIGYDEVKLTDSGELVRNGLRQRSSSSVRFIDGKLADQMLVVNRESGKKLVEGNVRGSRPDGDWLWYDRDGKPAFKEVWKDGKLDALFKAEITKAKAPAPAKKTTPAKPGTPGATTPPVTPPVTPPAEVVNWKAASKAEKDERLFKTVATFAALPELIRE